MVAEARPPTDPPVPEPGPAPRPAADPRPALLGLPRQRLAERLAPVVDRPFRVGQVYDALHRRGVADFASMTELSRELRDELDRRFRVGQPEIVERRPAADGTTKYLLRLADGATVEAVDIPAPRAATPGERHTLCISSQAGCALACAFCVTGFWGAGRNLTAGEIVGQVLAAAPRLEGRGRELPESLNIVFMGMGEPLLNLAAVRDALEILTERISWRRITVSTSGIVPGIEEMARWERRPNLAISLHAADDALRTRIMPINRTWPLADLLAALERYPLEKGRRITIEYILIRGLNDAPEQADLLARRLARFPAKVNLIPINPDPVLGAAMVPPEPAAVDAFHRRLKQRGLVSTVRQPRGDDVSAACGQLRAFGRDPKGFRGRSLGAGFQGAAE
ncbi:MAG TPA: 23S rRNA (adenine(2503)-C(2))-methyltransferase RlmN [Thermoanaerobaculia bacterium]|nr:23S rRNA (adenine(2503)-C(2))-methyltransferase RlmN [Thermoanaerobaculia bacterium]